MDRLRIMEEKRKSVPDKLEENDIDEEEFEEVIGSGLTSETEEKVKTPRDNKPKTIPGRRLQVKEDKKQEKVSVNKKIKTRKKTGKTEISLANDETTQTVITQIEFIMPKTSQDFEKQLSNMKHIPQATKPPPSKFKIPATLRQETSSLVALPPLVAKDKPQRQKLKHQFVAEYDKYADKEFYKDFHFTFIPLPMPTEELPRKLSISIVSSLFTNIAWCGIAFKHKFYLLSYTVVHM